MRGEQRGGIAQQRRRFGAWAGQVAQQRGVSAAAALWARQRRMCGSSAQQRGVGAAAARRGAARALAQVAGQAERRREAGAAAARSVVADTLRIRSGGESAVGRVRTLAL